MERTLTRRKGVIPMFRGIHPHGLLLPSFVNEDCDVIYPPAKSLAYDPFYASARPTVAAVGV